MNDALARLAAACGIARDYHDIWGKRHEVPEATLVALLAAMGVAAGDAAAAAAALVALDDAQAAPGMAPLVVLRQNVRPWTVRAVVPGAVARGPICARVTCEDGTLHAADVVFHPPDSSTRAVACVAVDIALPASLATGYHRLELVADGTTVARTCCAVAPAACYLPAGPPDRVWGAAAQLYGLRSERNWGIGDFTDLATLLEQWGGRGADVVGVNPLHALFPHQPRHASPYSPSSRLFRNTQYLDVEAVADFAVCEKARALVASAQFQQTLATLREATLVDYAGVAAVKQPVLELLFRHFCDRHLALGDPRAQAFRAYVEAGGTALRRHALFEALQEHFHRGDPGVWGWPAWPAAFRDPGSAAVAGFAAANAARIDFYAYLQWQAELQLAAAAGRARAAGLSIGVYADLAVSIDRGGAEAWAQQDVYALGASVGAPPDAFNPRGQDWGLPPQIPARLRAEGYAPFLATLRANMRHAGAVRIDHVMGLARLFWVPQGSNPADGAYVHYPFDDLLGLTALESHRHRCMVIGEDLGTVPEHVREALARNAILSYRVLFFERDAAEEFTPPAAYPATALVTTSTHDLPTLAGWWAAADIDLRADHGLLGNDVDRDALRNERALDRSRLLAALKRADLPAPELALDPALDVAAAVPMTPALARAVQSYLCATPARLHVVQLEDAVGVTAQANLPGTVDSHPNWRRKLPLTLAQFADDERFTALAAALGRERPRARAATRAPAPRVPRATYRLQLNGDFTFAHATQLVPYLAMLGVSHVYCSPYLRARPGSLHGYDIVDHGMLNPEIGSRADFDRFVAALDAHGMGHLCDVVPNHVGVMGADNRWWMDALENGPAS
ncbi:MAG: 4-alpha-glucanotransferase, partial [Casimicrobiaceae bacterium]